MHRVIKLVICLATLVVKTAFGGDTLYLQQEAIIDSGSFRIGIRPMIVDDTNAVHIFYTAGNTDTDFVYQAISNDWGHNWSMPEKVSFHQHPEHERYFAYGPSADVDADGNIHLIYAYRGKPLYSSWSDYPPDHINYVTNATGSWITYQDVVNDSAIQTSEGNGSTVSYLFSPFVLSEDNAEHFIAADYAWWAKKYHVVFSERNTGGNWAEGSALVTYDRGVIDCYTIPCASLLSDGVSIYAIWFNRYTGELKFKTYNGSDWSVDSTIFTADSPVDGSSPRYYTMSPTSGDGVCYLAMNRNEGNTLNEIFFVKKDASGWTVDTVSTQDTLYSVSSCVLNDTAYIFYRTTGWRNKLIKHTTDGFSTSQVLLTQDGNQIVLYTTVIENRIQPIVWVAPNQDTTMWYLYSGTLSTTGVSEEQQDYYFNLTHYPNPTTSVIRIQWSGVSEKQEISLQIYDLSGRLVKTLIPNPSSRISAVEWDARSITSGIYFIRFRAGDYSETKKIVLTR